MKHFHNFKHKTKTIRSYRNFKKGALFASGFAIIGIASIINAIAATPTAHFEAESANRSANAQLVTDSTASGGQALRFGDGGHGGHVPDNCTPGPGVLGSMGPCIDMAYITPAVTGASTELFDTCLPVPNPATYCSNGVGEQSAFRTQCSFSHMNKDDAVLFRNQPGVAHLHTYFGNTGANYASTSTTLRNSGNSTCRGGIFNRSAYWVPTMVNGTNGRPLSMDGRNTIYPDLDAYYKLGYQGIAPNAVQPYPAGLQMIAGNSSASTGPNTALNPPVVYYCDGQGPSGRILGPRLLHIPSCPAGQAVTMHINFQQCWDGVNLTTPNGRSHLAYGTWGVGCPSTHPVGFPFVEMLVRYQVRPGEDSSTWRLSSDNYTSGPGGYSGHADYIFAWPEDAFQTVIERCHRAQVDCKYQLGDGRCPVTVPGRNECGSQ